MKTKTPIKKRKVPSRRSRVPAKKASSQDGGVTFWNLRLYVAGQTPKSLTAFSNLKRLCEEHLCGRYEIEVIDLSRQPHLAQSDQIVALPTLVRKLPEPIKRLIGDLSQTERVMLGMEIAGVGKK